MLLLVQQFSPATWAALTRVFPGLLAHRWSGEVRPGDTLSMRVTVTDARVSRSKPDRGVVNVFSEVLNQRGETVMSMKPINFFRLRPAQ